MKILLLDQFSELGGAQQTLLDTVEAVRRKGWQARALVPGRGPLVETLRSLGVPTGEIPSGPYGSGSKSVADSMRFAWDVRRQVATIGDLTAQEDFDVIYVNGPRIMPAAALASRGRAQTVFHAHSHVDGIAARLLHWSIRTTAATVIACSNSVLDPLRHCAAPDDVHVLPNGVRDMGYRERAFGRGGGWRIGIIGRIAPDKGQLEFADAAAILAGEFPRARFVICGAALFGSTSGYFDAVRQRSRGLPVEFLEWQHDVGRILSELDLLVVPSKREGMARVIVEAFSAGLPVVAFPAGGVPEMVLDGETGFLIRQFSADALASRIREVIGSPEALQRVARNARQAWARSYTVPAYQELVVSLMEGFPNASPEAHQTEALRLGR